MLLNSSNNFIAYHLAMPLFDAYDLKKKWIHTFSGNILKLVLFNTPSWIYLGKWFAKLQINRLFKKGPHILKEFVQNVSS